MRFAIQPFGNRPTSLEYLNFLLWPTLPLGVVEHGSTWAYAALVTVGSNIILFSLFGLAFGLARNRRSLFLGTYLVLAGFISLVAAWLAGFDRSEIDWLALATALSFYGLVVWIAVRMNRTSRPPL
jgi:hypothetical protein